MMRSLGHLFLAVLVLLTIASTALSQRRPSDQINDMKRQRADLDRRQQDMNALEMEKERQRKGPDPELLRRMEIIRNVKELGESSDALLVTVKTPEKDSLKEAAKLADKIAKSSKRLRQDLINGKSASKIEAIEFPLQGEDRLVQLRQLAEKIDGLVDKVLQHDFVRIVDVELLEQTGKQLESIESQALSLRLLAKRKD
jgi:hypothetical protein